MTQSKPKPEGSRIEEVDEFDGRTYRWKASDGGLLRFFLAGFIICWLGGWAIGLISAIGELMDEFHGFLLFWLGAWSVGGCFAIFVLYNLLRPQRPESITLKHYSFYYDSGSSFTTSLFNPAYGLRRAHSNEALSGLFKRRQQIEIAKSSFSDVVLERTGERQRLYFDHGADRIEIGMTLREPEREWLAGVIEQWSEE